MKRRSNMVIFSVLMAAGLFLSLVSAACAPSASIIATLTMLPGTFTPIPPTRGPTNTPYPTYTHSPFEGYTPEQTRTPTPSPSPSLIPASACPPFAIDSAPPDDPSQMVDRHYDLAHLPDAFTNARSGMLENPSYAWVQVRWQGRSLYWIERIACRNAVGTAFWQITDALALPRLDPKLGEAETTLCASGGTTQGGTTQGGTTIRYAVAYGLYDPSKPAGPVIGTRRGWPVQVQAAWVMKERFVPLDMHNVVCMVEEPSNGG